jgi:hypothetical protein
MGVSPRRMVVPVLALCLWAAGCRGLFEPTPSPEPSGSPGPVGSPQPDGGEPTCSTLDETACAARTDCAADHCSECSCTPTFVGCRAVTEAPHACPMLGCPTPLCCRTNGDCLGDTSCVAPGPICSGACAIPPFSCSSDADCLGAGDGYICGNLPCSCVGVTQNFCVLGCSSTNPCPEGETCGGDHHCSPQVCGPSAPCPKGFGCSGGAASTCARMACQTDTDCADGSFCVDGMCYAGLGECRAPTP